MQIYAITDQILLLIGLFRIWYNNFMSKLPLQAVTLYPMYTVLVTCWNHCAKARALWRVAVCVLLQNGRTDGRSNCSNGRSVERTDSEFLCGPHSATYERASTVKVMLHCITPSVFRFRHYGNMSGQFCVCLCSLMQANWRNPNIYNHQTCHQLHQA